MLLRRHHRRVHVFLAIAYLAANVASGVFHDHEHGHAEHAECGHESCSPLEAEDGGFAVIRGGRESGQNLHDDDCVVCRFAGQRTLQSHAVELGPARRLATRVEVARAEQQVQPFARTTHSRAPPAIA